MGEENLYQNCCKECGIPIDSDEYGSYCPMHRLDMNGCCRNHCLIDEEGVERHCYHCVRIDDDFAYCRNCENYIMNEYPWWCENCVRNKEREAESTCVNCGDDINPDEGPICELCTEYDYETEESVTATDEINYFHALYQHLAPTTEEQKQRLTEIKVQLCEECNMPCEFIWCDDCGFN